MHKLMMNADKNDDSIEAAVSLLGSFLFIDLTMK